MRQVGWLGDLHRIYSGGDGAKALAARERTRTSVSAEIESIGTAVM
jgi:hypothetical protein